MSCIVASGRVQESGKSECTARCTALAAGLVSFWSVAVWSLCVWLLLILKLILQNLSDSEKISWSVPQHAPSPQRRFDSPRQMLLFREDVFVRQRRDAFQRLRGDREASPFLEFSPPYRASLWFQAAETKRFEIGRSSGGAGICKSCWTTADKYGKEGGSRWGQSVSYLEKYKQFHPGFRAKSIFKWVIAGSIVFILFLRCWVWSHLFLSFKIPSIKYPVLTRLHPDVRVKMVIY